MSICDKCGKAVAVTNDATRVWALATGDPLLILLCAPRHFLPEGDCPGSPSRAQYIEGQPRDTRGYPYDQNLEKAVRAAYKELLEENSKA